MIKALKKWWKYMTAKFNKSFDEKADPILRGHGVIYWNPVKGTTVDTPFGKLLSRKAYRSSTTNRNLRTLQKIVGE